MPEPFPVDGGLTSFWRSQPSDTLNNHRSTETLLNPAILSLSVLDMPELLQRITVWSRVDYAERETVHRDFGGETGMFWGDWKEWLA